MTGNVVRSSSLRRKEVLKRFTGAEGIDSIVIDATHVALPTDVTVDPFVVPEGTPLVASASTSLGNTGQTGQLMPWSGTPTQTIVGILVSPVYLSAQATQGSSPGAMYWFNTIFATTGIVGFTLNPSKFATDLPGNAFR